MSRIQCCIPFCKRTTKRADDDDDETEMICREHGKLASKGTRRFWSRTRKKANKLMEKDPEQCSEQEQRYILRVCKIARKAWLTFKFECIERAGGLS